MPGTAWGRAGGGQVTEGVEPRSEGPKYRQSKPSRKELGQKLGKGGGGRFARLRWG